MGFWVARTRKGAGRRKVSPPIGDLAFLHGFEQGGLDFGGSTVDFVRQHDIMKKRSLFYGKFTCLGMIDLGSQNIRGQQIRGELDAFERGVYGLGQGFDSERLGQAGNTFEQNVAFGEQGR